MGQLAIPLLIAAAGAQIYTERQASGAQQVELEMQKRGEDSAARDREVQRKRRLNAILGAQSAVAAASGLQSQGSVANISLVDATRAGQESFIDQGNTRARIASLSRQQASIRRVSAGRTATTILQTGASIYGASYKGASGGGTGAGIQADSGLQSSATRYA